MRMSKARLRQGRASSENVLVNTCTYYIRWKNVRKTDSDGRVVKVLAWSHLTAGIAGAKPAETMDVLFLFVVHGVGKCLCDGPTPPAGKSHRKSCVTAWSQEWGGLGTGCAVRPQKKEIKERKVLGGMYEDDITFFAYFKDLFIQMSLRYFNNHERFRIKV